MIVRARLRSERGSLALSVAATVAVAAIVFAVLAAFRLNAVPQRWPAFAPPKGVIGVVWIVLFAAMGAARWFAARSASLTARTDAQLVVGLMALCLAYPFYTHLLAGHAAELVGNVVSLAYAVWLIARVRTSAPVAALLIGLVALWMIFATVLVFGLVELNGWSA